MSSLNARANIDAKISRTADARGLMNANSSGNDRNEENRFALVELIIGRQ